MIMPDDRYRKILLGILIVLIFIAMKPAPTITNDGPDFPYPMDVNTGERAVQLSENRIAIISNKYDPGTPGAVIVLEFNEKKETFDFIGKYNYLKDIGTTE